MTLCIAAACQYKDNPALVFCSDTRTQSSSRDWNVAISSDNADKSRYVGEFAAYVAGDPTLADELITMWETTVKSFSAMPDNLDDFDIHMNDLLEGLRAGARLRKKKIQDHFFGMTSPFKDLEDFRKHGKEMLPQEQYRQLWDEMRSLHLGAEVILGGFHCEQSIIIKVGMDGEPKWVDQYAVIGTGSADALTFLAQNEFDEEEIQLQDCLMRLMEAAEFVSNANKTVSHTSRFEVRVPHQKPYDITTEFFDLMKLRCRLAKPADLGDPGEFLVRSDDELSSEMNQSRLFDSTEFAAMDT